MRLVWWRCVVVRARRGCRDVVILFYVVSVIGTAIERHDGGGGCLESGRDEVGESSGLLRACGGIRDVGLRRIGERAEPGRAGRGSGSAEDMVSGDSNGYRKLCNIPKGCER